MEWIIEPEKVDQESKEVAPLSCWMYCPSCPKWMPCYCSMSAYYPCA